nr:restriction endonuclease subunit S [Wohlfahrtiimonas chitiniclastica]
MQYKLYKNKKIPKYWLTVSIGEISNVVSGGTPRANNPLNFSVPNTGIAWLTPADLSGYTDKYISHGARDLSQLGYESSSAKLIPAGSLLFSSRAPIGYVAIASNEMSTSQGFKSFIFPKYIDSNYAYYYLRSIRGLAENFGTGTTFKEISSTVAKTLPFILPPLDEQKVIADKLEFFLEKTEAIRISLENTISTLKEFRRSVLNNAMSGELTEYWRKNKPNNGLDDYNKIQKYRELTVIGKNKTPQSHLSSEEYNIPDSWFWVSLDSLTSHIVDGTHHTPKYVKNGIPFISVKDVRNGDIDFSDTKFIEEKEHLKLSKRCRAEKGDLLITKSGTIGRTAIVNTTREFSLFVSVALLKPASNSVNMKFINIALQKWVNEIDISSRIVGSAIKNLHLRDMRVLSIPFAPLNEQTEIVRRVEELFSFADSIEQEVNSALDRVKNLSQSILIKAFQGDLTAEWRKANLDLISGENSAEALLEKIRIEREVLKKQSATKRRTTTKRKASKSMSSKIITVTEALKKANKPLSGQQLLNAAGYPNDSTTEELEKYFLDIRKALSQKAIVKLERDKDQQDWFALSETTP